MTVMNARIGHYIPGVSWDVRIMRLPPETSATDEIPEDWDLPMPGHWPDIRTARCELFLPLPQWPPGAIIWLDPWPSWAVPQ
jgi:hypothetical protein